MRRDLGDGLVLRWSTAADTDHIAEFTSLVFRQKADEPPNLGLADSVRRYMSGSYPDMGPDDFLVVEDTRKDGNKVVACSCYLREDWVFDGIPIPAARPEIVATDPAYRKKGLIRTIFDAFHERAERDARMVQGITGIPYFYRQFGYEYAIDLGGRLSVPAGLVPDLTDGVQETHGLRQATVDDIPALLACYRDQQSDSLVSRQLDDSFWRHHITAELDQVARVRDAEREGAERAVAERDTGDAGRGYSRVRIIETTEGKVCGFLLASYHRPGESFRVQLLGFRPGVNQHELAPGLLRELKRMADQVPTKASDVTPAKDAKPVAKIVFELGRDHPFYQAIRSGWCPYKEPPYAWYIRVPDLAGLLRHIAPVLEQRLAGSTRAGYTGELKLDFYRAGLRIRFDEGKLTAAEPFRFEPFDNSAKGGFPPLTILRLVFGRDSLAELKAMHPDVWADGEATSILEVLFPKRRSHLLGL